MTDARTLVEALACGRNGCDCAGAVRKGQGLTHCPAHSDTRPSLNVTQNGSSRALVHCHTSCSQQVVIAALKDKGLWGEVTTTESPSDVFEADYTYRDASGKAVAIKSRYRTSNGKRFVWRVADHENCKGLREHDLRVEDMPLYGSEFLAKAKEQGFALLVEGEKAAQACWRANLIAFCNPGGSGQKDFGTSLDILKGMDVVLWPDNDEPGRALMRAIKDKLGQARIVAPELPEKGDAVEYFLGHTKQDFLGLLDKLQDKPWAEEIAGGYLVSVPEMGGLVRFEFTGVDSYRTKSHEAEVTVWLDMPGASTDRFHARLNMVSLSNRDAFRRQLEDVLPLGKGVWGRLLNTALQVAHEAKDKADPSICLSQVTAIIKTEYVLEPWMVADGPTVLFGMGGSSKTFLALMMALSVVTGAPFLEAEPKRQGKVLYVDYEASPERLKARLKMIQNGMGIGEEEVRGLIYWPANGTPLPDLAPALLRKIKRDKVAMVVIDSAILACGGPPKEPEIVSAYFNALKRLGIPSLTISHVVKDEEGDKFPFGSIVWHNSARLTWNAKLQQEEGDSVIHVGLYNRKANDDKKAIPVGLRIAFEPDALVVDQEDTRTHFPQSSGLRSQILGSLEAPKCTKCLAEELGVSLHSIQNRIGELKAKGMASLLNQQCANHGISKWSVTGKGGGTW